MLLRRFWVLAVGLVLTFGVAAYLYTQTPPRYEATARMLLLLPADSRPTEGAGNPFLYLPAGLELLAGVAVSGPNSREFHDEMLATGLTSEYELVVQPRSPIITISVEGSDPQNVIATRDRIIEGVEEELKTVQREEETPPRQIAHARVYAVEEPELMQGNRTRGALVALGAGGVLTLLTAFGIDRGLQLLAERRRRNAAGGAADSGDASTSQVTWGWDTPGGTVDAESTNEPTEFIKVPGGQVEAASTQGIATDGHSDDPSQTGDHRNVEPEGGQPRSDPGHEGNSETAAPASGVPDGEVTHYQRA